MALLSDFESDKKAKVIGIIISIVLLIVLAGVFTNASNLSEPKIASNAQIFLSLLMIVLFVQIINYIKPNLPFLDYNGLGSEKNILLGLGLGVVFAVVLNINRFSLATPSAFSIVSDNAFILNILFVVISASWVELNFFRGFLVPSMQKWFEFFNLGKASLVLGIVIPAVVFGLFHYTVYQNDMTALTSAVIFAVITTIGGLALKTNSFELSSHALINYFNLVR